MVEDQSRKDWKEEEAAEEKGEFQAPVISSSAVACISSEPWRAKASWEKISH